MRLCRPFTDHQELEELKSVLASGHLSQGEKTAEFEDLFSEYLGQRFVFATSSGTAALHLSLKAMNIGPGDEVLVPDYTFPATANVVVHCGAVPVLTDIELPSFSMDPGDLERKITPKTKAIMPVHAFGCPVNINAILEIAERHGLPIIEDAACALGARAGDRLCGSFGKLACFSFHGRKIITTGEGGAIVTQDKHIAKRIEVLRNQGGTPDGFKFKFIEAGYNYRMSDLHAAVGIAQMTKLDKILQMRRMQADRLREMLSDHGGVTVPKDPSWGRHSYQSFVLILEPSLDRDKIIANLRSQGIEATIGTYALHAEPFYQDQFGYHAGDLPNSFSAFERTLTLPLFTDMSEAEIKALVSAFRNAVEQASHAFVKGGAGK